MQSHVGVDARFFTCDTAEDCASWVQVLREQCRVVPSAKVELLDRIDDPKGAHSVVTTAIVTSANGQSTTARACKRTTGEPPVGAFTADASEGLDAVNATTLANEIFVLRSLLPEEGDDWHLNVVKFFGNGRFLDNSTFYVMELMATSLRNLVYTINNVNGSVTSRPMEVLSFHHVFVAMRDAACGLRWLHDERSLPVVHGDINLVNLMVSPVKQGRPTEWIVKLADFGCGHEFLDQDEKYDTPIGSVGFQAPELVRAHRGKGQWRTHIDR
jgi:serine/threonine protein kinase